MGVEGQDVEGLGDHGEHCQTAQIAFDVPGVQQAHGQAVAENRKRQPPNPAEGPDLRKEGAAHMVDEHGDDGGELQKVRVQIRLQPGPLPGDLRGGGQGGADGIPIHSKHFLYSVAAIDTEVRL